MNAGSQLLNLDKILRDDDESDFLPTGGSNLAAIFGLQTKTDSSSSTKPAPKKGNISRTHQANLNKTEVIVAKAVHAFKLQNGKYTSFGRLGVALTGNQATKLYQIILYKTKQEHVSIVTISNDFVYTVQPNNYSSYFDNNSQNWSIVFENNDVCIEFAREVGIARYFSRNERIENVLYQDLSPFDKDVTTKEGDNLSLKYFITTEITQPIKNIPATYQTMTVEISADNNWEKTLLGSGKGLKRVLFLPPSKQISLGPGFPKERDVLLEIDVISIQTPDEDLQKIPIGKASIISRMAKMGQSILPKLPASTTTDSEDTEDDVSYKSSPQRKLKSSEEQKKHSMKESKEETIKSKALKPKNDVPATNAACKPFGNPPLYTAQWSPNQIQPNFVTLDGQVYSLQSQTLTPTMPTMGDPGLNMFLSETRISNAELRMGMSKIADNVQKLLDKFHVLELQNTTSPMKDRMALDATLKLLATNAAEESEKNNVASENLAQLNEMKDKIELLEKELKHSKEKIRELEAQEESLTHNNAELRETIKELGISLTNVTVAFDKERKKLDEAKELNSKFEKETTMLENKMLKLSEECNCMEKNDNKNKEIKQIMNGIYHALLDKFMDESYSKNSIKAIIGDTIKNVTLQTLYNENSDVKSESVSTDIKETNVDNVESKVSDLKQIPPTFRTEPPPVPPNDTEDNSEW